MEAALRAREQALEDLATSSAAEVTFIRCDDPGAAGVFAAAALDRAGKRKFAVAEVSLLGDRGFDALDSLVRILIRTMGPPALPPEQRGLLAHLDAFVDKHGQRSREWFDSGAQREAAYGDLTEIARDYVDGRLAERHASGKLEQWLSGTVVDRAEEAPTLNRKSAKRALSELTRLVRLLGYRGLFLAISRGETLTKLPQARRRDAYTVLRELVDNVDGGRGLVATHVVVFGRSELYTGPRSVESLTPLALRMGSGRFESGAAPHRVLVDLVQVEAEGEPPEVRLPDKGAVRELRALVRAASGLPPTEGVPTLSVGYEKIDQVIVDLLSVSALKGSVFAELTGAYGSGKTHLLLHLADRALDDRRPVLRLAVEAAHSDLGQPQRHLRRLLEDSTLPLGGRPSITDLLYQWTSREDSTTNLVATLERLSSRDDEVGEHARSVARAAKRRKNPRRALESLLSGRDLSEKPATRRYRAAAYGRLLLWLTLLEELEGLKGPVLFIDEAENLYRGGVARAERRTALRSLAFYCGGVIASGCVVLALTKDASEKLADECEELLGEVDEQASTLTWEDAAMFLRRLRRPKVIPVPALKQDAAHDLARAVRKAHRAVRGSVRAPGIDALVDEHLAARDTPRAIVRTVVDCLERAWWESGE
jgi:hypothetical protein